MIDSSDGSQTPMFVEFTCGECGTEQTHLVTIESFEHIKKGVIPLRCKVCCAPLVDGKKSEGSATVESDDDARVGEALGDGPVEVEADVEGSEVRVSDIVPGSACHDDD